MRRTAVPERLLPAGMALAAGVLLLSLAWPRLDTALLRVMPDGVVADLTAGGEPSLADVARAATRLSGSSRLQPDAGGLGDLAALQLHQALAAGPETSAGARLAAASRQAQAAALERRPGDGFGWFRLAQATILSEGVGPEAARYLAASLTAYPAAGELLLPRLELAFLMWPLLAEETRAAVAPQIRLAAAGNFWRRRALVDLARSRFALPQVRAALREDAALAADFQQFYRRWSRRPVGS